MTNFVIEKGTGEDMDVIEDGLAFYNNSKVPFTQDPPFMTINRVIKDENGQVVAGISTLLYCWNCLYIDVLWVSESCRNKGYGAALLQEVERVAKEEGCYLAHLDTFDFQAKDFYLKQGYEVFGVLENCPPGHTRYYMKKKI